MPTSSDFFSEKLAFWFQWCGHCHLFLFLISVEPIDRLKFIDRRLKGFVFVNNTVRCILYVIPFSLPSSILHLSFLVLSSRGWSLYRYLWTYVFILFITLYQVSIIITDTSNTITISNFIEPYFPSYRYSFLFFLFRPVSCSLWMINYIVYL